MENGVQSKIDKEALFQAIYEVYSLGMNKVDLKNSISRFANVNINDHPLEEIYAACIFKFDQEYLSDAVKRFVDEMD